MDPTKPVVQETVGVCSKCSQPLAQCCCSRDAETAARLDPWVGKVLGDRYEILSLIESGGMSHVYRARHKTLKSIRAVKLMRSESLSATSLRRFENEAVALGNLVHPNLVSCIDHGITAEGAPFVVMEFIEGRTIAQTISGGETFSPARTIEIALQVCRGLQYAHQASVFHRDIKPSNLILVTDPHTNAEIVKILDFGIAKFQDNAEEGQKLTRTGEICGSPVYMSPEQGRGLPVDARSDLYSLGCVMTEMLTGKPPFLGSNAIETIIMHLNDPPKLTAMPDGKRIPSALEAVILRCLEKDISRRYHSAEELMKDLELIARGDSLVGLKFGNALNHSRWKRLHRIFIAVVTLGWLGFVSWQSGLLTGKNWSGLLAQADRVYYDLDSAEKCLSDALANIPKDDQYERNRAAVYMSWGRLYASRGRFDDARRCFQESERCIEMYKSRVGGKGQTTYLPLLADAFQGLAACDLSQNKLTDAEAMAQKAVKTREESLQVSLLHRMVDARLLARAYGLLGSVEMRLKHYDKALTAFEKAKAIESKYEDEKLHLSTTLEQEGDAYVALGNTTQGLELYGAALEIRKAHNPGSVASLIKKQATLQLKSGLSK